MSPFLRGSADTCVTHTMRDNQGSQKGGGRKEGAPGF